MEVLASASRGCTGAGGIGAMACVDPSMPLNLMVYLGQSDFWGMPMKFCVSFPLVYHFMGAIRHTVRRTLPLHPHEVEV